MSRLWRTLSVFAVFLCLAAGAVSEVKLMSRQTDAYFQTVSMLFLYCDDAQEEEFPAVWSQVKSLLAEIEDAVSLSVPDSDIARFNALPAGGRIPISAITADILSIAFDAYEKTGGLYDPTVFPLVDLWGFSPRFNRNAYNPSMPYDRAYENGQLPLPDARHIDALLPLVGLTGISLEAEGGVWYLQKNTPPVTLDGAVIQAQLDLGGIAKGYACDRVLSLLRSRGFTMGHFVCGGSSMGILSRPSGDGTAALTLGKPRPGSDGSISHYATVRTKDVTLSTSSDSTHSYTRGGVRYCHIIDPRTGWPVNMPENDIQRGAASITLLAPSAAMSDALTTALFLMSPQEAAAYISKHVADDLVVAAYYRTGADTLEVMTNAAPDCITLDDPAYAPASIIGEDGSLKYTGTFFSP